MAIPGFAPNGLIPPFLNSPIDQDRSPYLTSVSELTDVLGTSKERRDLLRNLITYRALFAADDYAHGFQFIDGSFVENVESIRGLPPGDIDVFSIMHAPQKYLSNMPLWQTQGLHYWNDTLVNCSRNKDQFKLDTYGLIFEEVSWSIFELLKNTFYWYSLFFHQKTTYQWKGFLLVPLDPADDAVASAKLGVS